MRPSSTHQTQCFEYQISGTLDGSTLAPDVDVSGPFNTEQIYTVDVPGNAGLFSLRFNGDKNAPYSDRFVLWMQVQGAVPGTLVAEVVDAASGLVQEAIFSVAGSSVFHGEPFLVPQGSLLRLSGPGAAQVRVRWAYASSVREYMDLSCCTSGGGGGGGGGTCPPAFAPSGGVAFFQGVAAVRSFAGVGFDAAASVSILADLSGTQSGTPTLNSATVTPGGPGQSDLLTVELDTSGATGQYLLVLQNPDGCSTALSIGTQPPPP